MRCKILCNYGVGYSHIDLPSAENLGICVTNTPDVLSDCTADIAMTLLLMAARRAGEGERELRANKWIGWRPTHMIGAKVTGKTLGIIGFGQNLLFLKSYLLLLHQSYGSDASQSIYLLAILSRLHQHVELP